MGALMKFLLLALAVIWLLHSPALRGLTKGEKRSGNAPTPRPRQPDTMVACSHCGLHLPAAEALRDGQGRLFCSTDHRDAAARG